DGIRWPFRSFQTRPRGSGSARTLGGPSVSRNLTGLSPHRQSSVNVVFPHPIHYPPAIVPNVYTFKDFEGSSHRILIELIRRFAPPGGTLLDLGAAGGELGSAV